MSRGIVFRNRNNEKIYPCPYMPIGSIYISVNNTNPSTYFGGSWQQIKDRFLLCAGDTYKAGNTGGSSSNTLTESNLPPRAMVRQTVSGTKYGCSCNTGISNTWANICMNDGGFTNSKAINNMPPYIVVYVWKRVS